MLIERLTLLVEGCPRSMLASFVGLVLNVAHRATMRMLAPSSDKHVPFATGSFNDRLLTAQEVADLLHVSVNWVHVRSEPSHPEYLKCARRISARKLRYSERALREWMRARA